MTSGGGSCCPTRVNIRTGFLAWFVSCIVVICCCSGTTDAATDREMLESFYKATGGQSHWNKTTGWMKSANICNWYGVTCSSEGVKAMGMSDDGTHDDKVGDDDATNSTTVVATDDAGEKTSSGNKTDADDDNVDDDTSKPTTDYGYVIGLSLDGNNLHGTLPDSVFMLPSLQKLDLKNNPRLKVPLTSILLASKLEVLIISNTNTTTSDLQGLGKASALTQLHLTNNNLTGTIPSDIFNITSMQQLYLAFNKFTGTIPSDGLYKLTSLTDLYLYNNFLNGTIPEDIGTNNKELKSLTLGGNMLTGTLPSSLNNLTHLRSLSIRNLRADQDLGSVGLSGPLLDFPNANYLVEVHLNHNNLTGTIPSTLLFKTKTDGRLVSVNLTSNMLNGAIPEELTRFDKLSLDVTDNRFVSGDLPSTFCSKTSWMDGLVKTYGCEAILCPSNSTSPLGMRTEKFKCSPCTLPGTFNDWDDDAPTSTDDDSPLTNTSASIDGNFTAPDQSPFMGKLQCDQENTAEDVGEGEIASSTNLERDILTELYRATGGSSSWSVKDFWLDNTKGICSWYGIQCKIFDGPHSGDAGVEAILLDGNHLTGTIPSSIYNLPLLAEVNFQRNDVKVTFDNIENASSTLVSMYLAESKIDSLQKLVNAANLTKLILSRNKMTGPFPEELFSLKYLQELQLEDNQLTGTLPKDISTWEHMERFDVTNNNFTGALPSFKKLSKLRILGLSANGWTGNLPSSLHKATSLEVLSVYGSPGKGKLTGPILDFANCSKLVELYLEDNQFTGSIPSNFFQYTEKQDHMVEINLARNNLTGTLPEELGQRFDRLNIDITGNKITEIPSSLCSKGSWMEGEVKLNGCDGIACAAGTYRTPFGRATKLLGKCNDCPKLASDPYLGHTSCPSSNATTLTTTSATNGTITSSSSTEESILKIFYYATKGKGWRNQRNWLKDGTHFCTWDGISCAEGVTGTSGVTRIRLEYNNLDGTVPSEIYSLPKLQELSLARNKNLAMNFTYIKKAVSLTTLYLAEVKLHLDGIKHASSLTKLGIPNSGLAGPFPSEILEIITLHELDLSFNMFHGTVPHDISLLSSNLTTLLLNNNEFTGTIPTQLGLLTELTELDLSVNGFEGQLPEELNNLINLEVLAIKNQNNQDGFPSLNGPLLDFQNLTVLTELYLQDNELSGTIPSSFLKNSAAKSDAAVYVGLSRNQLNGTVPASLGNLEHMIIDLDDNNITNIDSSLCTSKNWMEGNVDKYGCDGILCPAGWYQKFSGRQTSDASPCTKCQLAGGAPFMGSKTCVNTVDKIARGILNTLYIQTGGDNWYMKGNWTSPDVPVCFWHGIKCHSGGDKISSIQLGANNLIGTSPPELFDLPGLNELWLYSNPMQVNFTGIERANTLRTLLLDGMGLVSIDGLGKGNSLERLDLRFNSINGSFPYEEITSLVNLKSLSLANNLLTGPLVSYGFDKLANLTNLRLDNNVLTGALPDFADFPSLVSLDVSNNKFDSSIPAKFLAGILYTSNLIAVNLANNELTGEISSDVFGRFKIMTLYVRGNKFTSMSEALCKMNQWNDGDVGQYGCDALACPLGHANEMGRRSTDSNFCVVCQAAKYLGTTECTSPGFNARSNSAGISIFGSFSRWAVKSLLASLIGVVFFV